MVTYVSDTNQVDKLARSVIIAGDFTSPQVVKEQEAAYADIGIATGKWDWNALDKRFPGVQKIEQEYAAGYIIAYYGSGTPEELAASAALLARADASLQRLVDNPTTDDESSADSEIRMAVSLFASYPASLQDDPNAMPYRSTNVSV